MSFGQGEEKVGEPWGGDGTEGELAEWMRTQLPEDNQYLSLVVITSIVFQK